MKKVILFLVLLLTLSAVIGLAGCGGPTTPLLTYAVGDTGPAGGWIFYDKGSYSDGWRYLEAAPSDQSTGIQWYDGYYGVVTGATGTAIGTGQSNTTAIVTIQGAGSYAAQLCNDLIVGGYSDWFFPSKDELAAMRTNLASTSEARLLYGFAGYYYYWSSSESPANLAWFQNFYNGNPYYPSFKSNSNRVRAVRAF